jgi:hypothetical protein
MTLYVSTKHATEGYSGSLDHEVRDYGVRICSSSPARSTPRSEPTACRPTPHCRR